MSKFLYEVVPFKARIVEARENGRMVVEGVFQASDRKNANGRVYPRSLWEKVLKNDNTLKAIDERRMFGELDHPQDGKWELKRASHIVTGMSMNESGEILGRAEILDTPNGKILQELFSAGATVGISSRGSGSVKKTADGDVVQEDYKLETYDFVANPSTFGAFPKLVSENIENDEVIKENSMDSRDKLALLEQKASSVLSLKPADVTDSFRPVVEGVSTELIISLTKLGAESSELKPLTESLVQDLTDKRKELKASRVVEGMPPWLKKKGGDDEEEDKEKKGEKKEEKPEPKEKKEAVEDVEEETSGSADSGFHRSVPKEAPPAAGEGWPINPEDAGVLAGINSGVDEFMSASESIEESDDEDEDDEEKDEAVEEEKDTERGEDEEEEMESTVSRSEQIAEICTKLISVEATEENFVARAIAAAFLMENSKRVTEAQAYGRVVGKLQEKLKEAAETGKITLVETDTKELEEKLNAAYSTIEELETRHRLLSAKVYAEAELKKVGLADNADARKAVAEAIRKAATKAAIDEAIMVLSPVKGLKVEKSKNEIKESEPVKTLEGTVAKLNETESKESAPNKLEGAALGKYLSGSLNFSRSR